MCADRTLSTSDLLANDFDQHTTAVLSEVIFPHQKAWVAVLSSQQIRELGKHPATNLGEVFARFEPRVRFEVGAAEHERLLCTLRRAGCSIADTAPLTCTWRVFGPLSCLDDFTPAGTHRAWRHFEHNVLAVLDLGQRLYEQARELLSELDFDRPEPAADQLAGTADLLREAAAPGQHQTLRRDALALALPQDSGSVQRVSMAASVLEDLVTMVQSGKGRDASLAGLHERVDAIRRVKEEVLSGYLGYLRPVEKAYRQLACLFDNAGDAASVIVVPALPREIDDEKWLEYSTDFHYGDIPPKIAALREIMRRRNNTLVPQGWVGLVVVPDLPLDGLTMLHKALLAFAERNRQVLLTTPRPPGRRQMSLEGLIEFLERDPQAQVLASGTSSRVALFVGDLEGRGPHHGQDDQPLDQPMRLAPCFAVAGVLARNNRGSGIAPLPDIRSDEHGVVIRGGKPLIDAGSLPAEGAHNAELRRLNLVLHDARVGQAYLSGASVGGHAPNLSAQRMLDKLMLLARKVIIENSGGEAPTSPEQVLLLQQELQRMLAVQEQLGLLVPAVDNGLVVNRHGPDQLMVSLGPGDTVNKVDIESEGEGCLRLLFAVQPTSSDTSFNFEVVTQMEV
jgi:hypothetical protein